MPTYLATELAGSAMMKESAKPITPAIAAASFQDWRDLKMATKESVNDAAMTTNPSTL